MFFYDRLFVSMYALSGRTNSDSHPSSTAAWILLSGLQSANVLALLFFRMYMIESGIGLTRSVIFLIIGSLLVLNAVYIALRGNKVLARQSSLSPVLAIAYAALSVFALLGVMGAMYMRVADRVAG
ncbi:hypothetical protein [Lysobacter niastensis]|uniref:DUF202 domain-containing protein n=1 Tax=Lysobacter niastensis TaxID=380629 RepID=A0ABS0B4Y9_9GAMM|nr:hypothetical protein [Lysobacter niastensis]MBF6023801.1 hypothetical protein [Lysobacter niastensis]